MDALIRVMVGAAALCAASVAFAGPVVVDGDPDEPDIGGGVVEPAPPHHTSSPSLKTLSNKTSISSSKSGRITLNCEVVYLNNQNEPMGDSRTISIGVDPSRNEFFMFGTNQKEWAAMYSANSREFVLAHSDARILTVNRATGELFDIIVMGSGSSLERRGVCKPGKEENKRLF